MADVAASVLARLKNKSKEEEIQLQQLLNLLCQEEFIRRLSYSSYKKHMILKGGYLLYSISGFTARPTIDADYLLKNYPNNLNTIEELVTEIISQPSENNFIKFQVRGLSKIGIAKEYPGVRVNLVGKIGRTITPFSIDFGVGDVIIPSPIERKLPVLLADFESPEILTYSLESSVAKKLDAIISLMEATSRMKDFYDIYYLATSFNFEGKKLQEAIYQTLTNRETPYEMDSIRVINRLTNNALIQQRWKSFCLKILQYELDLTAVVDVIIDFTEPPFQAMINQVELSQNWSFKEQQYY